MITVREAIQRVEQIKQNQYDDERAHGEEDDLWRDALCAIANGHRSPRTLATTVLATQDIPFHRWAA